MDELERHHQINEARRDLRVAAGELAHLRAEQYMADHGEKNYSVALRAVLDADPELKRKYAAAC